MELRISETESAILVEIIGPLADDAREVLNESVHPLAGAAGTQLVLDLEAVPRVTSNGLGALVSLVAWANAHQSRIILAAATPFVLSVFRATRLDSYLELAPSREDALLRLRATD